MSVIHPEMYSAPIARCFGDKEIELVNLPIAGQLLKEIVNSTN